MKMRLLCPGAVILLIFAAGGWAQQPSTVLNIPKDKPIDIFSQKGTVVLTSDGWKATLFKGIKVVQGNLTLTCDEIEILYEEGGKKADKTKPPRLEDSQRVKSVTASGNVKIVQDDRVVVAGKAHYDKRKGTVEITGGTGKLPQLKQGQHSMVAQKFTIFLNENRLEMDNDGDGKIQMKIMPEEKKGSK